MKSGLFLLLWGCQFLSHIEGGIVKIPGPDEEAYALRMWREMCLEGRQEFGKDGQTSVFCVNSEPDPTAVEVVHPPIQLQNSGANQGDQVIVIDPPTQNYKHKITLQGASSNPKTTIYVRPAQDTHQLVISEAANPNSQRSVERPRVVYLDKTIQSPESQSQLQIETSEYQHGTSSSSVVEAEAQRSDNVEVQVGGRNLDSQSSRFAAGQRANNEDNDKVSSGTDSPVEPNYTTTTAVPTIAIATTEEATTSTITPTTSIDTSKSNFDTEQDYTLQRYGMGQNSQDSYRLGSLDFISGSKSTAIRGRFDDVDTIESVTKSSNPTEVEVISISQSVNVKSTIGAKRRRLRKKGQRGDIDPTAMSSVFFEMDNDEMMHYSVTHPY